MSGLVYGQRTDSLKSLRSVDLNDHSNSSERISRSLERKSYFFRENFSEASSFKKKEDEMGEQSI